MNISSVLLWGFAATVLLTSLTIAAQSLGLTRIDIPFIIGTMFTPDRDRAKVIGLALHLINGWLFAIVYGLFFEHMRAATWWFGALLGALQGMFIVAVLLPILPGIHPRMVSDFRGPEPTRLLEPPGFFVTNYGAKTPLVLIIVHVLYGTTIGAFYALSHA
ncbi:MAG: hypothetical protein JO093_19925 [Acidobacteria bacterium]|nr:hypothetical protein [Acidobacteriota bacterium]MBV9067497.1 hypothetical protein [Acidobacteriota bacterium]MBV9187893.1 hypothetical protein [Acidobacteriota bacterium]